MYGVLQKKGSALKKSAEVSRVKEGAASEVQPCPKCGEDFVKTHAYAINPLLMRNGPRPWSDRKDDNF